MKNAYLCCPQFTVTCKVAVCVIAPDVAVTVIVLVPTGVEWLDELPQPLSTAILPTRSVSASRLCMYLCAVLRRRAARPHGRRRMARESSEANLPPKRESGLPTSALVLTPVAIASVVVAAAPEGVMVDGEKLQVAFTGSPEQLKLICWLNPPAGVAVTVTVPLPLFPTVSDDGLTPIVNDAGAAALTVSVNAPEVEAA